MSTLSLPFIKCQLRAGLWLGPLSCIISKPCNTRVHADSEVRVGGPPHPQGERTGVRPLILVDYFKRGVIFLPGQAEPGVGSGHRRAVGPEAASAALLSCS